jgi:hypothetical protein
MNPESTERMNLERSNGHHGNGQSHATDAWSFGSPQRLLAWLKPSASSDPLNQRSAAANTAESPTVGPHAAIDLSDVNPIASPRLSFGKRGFVALYQWEGVVEEVNAEGFRARLVPIEGSGADASRVEYADFAYDDLADESDRDLVVTDAVFYWTIGKSRNAAGTTTNTSLVRFRRLPPATGYQTREASREAEALLADLGTD